MTDVDKYAAKIVGTMARDMVGEDMLQESDFTSDQYDAWRESISLATQMSVAILKHPDSFLAWYRGVTATAPNPPAVDRG